MSISYLFPSIAEVDYFSILAKADQDGSSRIVLFSFLGFILSIMLLSVLAELIGETLIRLQRFYGYQKLFALLKAPVVAVCVSLILSLWWSFFPYQDLYELHWLLMVCTWCLAGCWWWSQVIIPLKVFHLFQHTWLMLGVHLCGWILLVLMMVINYQHKFQQVITDVPDLEAEEISKLLTVWGIRSVLPLAIGFLVACYPDISLAIKSSPVIRRHFIAEGHQAFWCSSLGMRKFTKKLLTEIPPETGITSPHLFLGQTLFETNYREGDSVFLTENSHFLTVGRSGAGKFVSSIAQNLILHKCGGIFVSNKAELANFAVGRRTDLRLFTTEEGERFSHLGIDPRTVSKAKYHLPNGRCFVLDPTNQSLFNSYHDLLSEIDINAPNAPILINGLSMGSFPEEPNLKEPFFNNVSRGLFSASIALHKVLMPESKQWNLATCAEFCMGIDPVHRRADPAVFKKNLITMMQHQSCMSDFIQRNAASIAQLGDRTFGSVLAEFEQKTRWLSDTRIKQQLSHGSQFSYQDLGKKDAPVSVFLIAPRSSTDLIALLPWLRTHIELSIANMETRPDRSQEILLLIDEFKQFAQGITAIRQGITTMREANIRCWLCVQSWASLLETLGEQAAAELEANSAMEFFGTDHQTAEKISRMLGKYCKRQLGNNNPYSELIDLTTPQEIMHELRKGSDLKYVFPATTAPMKLRRVAYKPLKTEEGIRYRGLHLPGHYDDHIRRHSTTQ